MISPEHLQELQASAISRDIADLNFRSITPDPDYVRGVGIPEIVRLLVGEDALTHIGGHGTQYITGELAKLLWVDRFAADGGWWVSGQDPLNNWDPMTWGQFKPTTPMVDSRTGRPLKYLAPLRQDTRAFFPLVTHRISQQIAEKHGYGDAYRQRLLGGSVDDPDYDFWPWWLSLPASPILITEGAKKTATLISHGYAAIGLPGVFNGFRSRGPGNVKIPPRLIPDLECLALTPPPTDDQGDTPTDDQGDTPNLFAGHHITLLFDQDAKPSTRRKVDKALDTFSKLLAARDNHVTIAEWDPSEGKGIDDVLTTLPESQRDAKLTAIVKGAHTLKDFKRRRELRIALDILTKPAPTPDIETRGEYIPELPPIVSGRIYGLSAAMNSGKTYRMRQWIRQTRDEGMITIVFDPLNTLGQQAAREWGIPHIHDYHTDADSQTALLADISHNGGIVACINSAPRVQAMLKAIGKPYRLIFDEAMQDFTDAVEGGTLKGKWGATHEVMIDLMQGADAIALSEDGLDLDTLEYVKKLSGKTHTTFIRHHKTVTPWDVTLYRATPLSAFRRTLLDALRAGKNILYVTTSQAEGRRLEDAAIRSGLSPADIIRIDSETEIPIDQIDALIQERKPRLLILSPRAKSGVSIEGGTPIATAHFDSVWGYFPCFDTDTHKQLLGRYRPPVPRYVWVPAYINPDPGETASKFGAVRGFLNDAQQYAKHGGFTPSPDCPEQQAIQEYLASRRQKRWAQKINPATALERDLTHSGHQVRLITGGIKKDPDTIKLWDDIKKSLAWKDAQHYAGLKLESHHTPAWAHEKLDSVDASYETRCRARKVLMLEKFPGIDWDDPNVWLAAEFQPRSAGDSGKLPVAKGASLWAEAEFLPLLQGKDIKEAQRILQQRLKASHLLPTGGLKATLAAQFQPLVKQILRTGQVKPDGETEQAIKALALRYAPQLYQLWRIVVKADQSPEAIANKICRKFGLRTDRLSKIKTATGRQAWIYSVVASELWQQLVEARRRSLALAGIEIKFVPTAESPPHQGVCKFVPRPSIPDTA